MAESKFVDVTLWGDWDKAHDTFHLMASGQVMDEVRDVIVDELNKAKEELIGHIRAGDYHFAPLRDAWQKYKDRHGFDTHILIATGQYIDSFDVRQIGSDKWELKPQGGHGNMSNEELGEILEYGSGSTPPRPHWIFVKDKFPAKLRERLQARFRVLLGGR